MHADMHTLLVIMLNLLLHVYAIQEVVTDDALFTVISVLAADSQIVKCVNSFSPSA
jgi:hypothetical protein